jgi:hypothetical protein
MMPQHQHLTKGGELQKSKNPNSAATRLKLMSHEIRRRREICGAETGVSGAKTSSAAKMGVCRGM